MKLCKLCNKEYTISEYRIFYKNGKQYIGNQCKKCLNELSKNRMNKLYTANREKWLNRQKDYIKSPEQKQKRKEYLSAWQKRKEIENPEFKLRRRISTAIRQSFSNKKNLSILNYLPYSIKELKQHLENQFETWMNWNNYGPINLNKKTWQIDHIVPQSKLPYLSFSDDNFIKCWSLSNLRPLDAMENIKKGNKCQITLN